MGWAEGKEELRGLVRHRKQTCKRDECCLPERWWGGGVSYVAREAGRRLLDFPKVYCME